MTAANPLPSVTAFGRGLPALPPELSLPDYVALREMTALVSDQVGPVTRAASVLGAGENGGGGYSAHAELTDLDGLLRDTFEQPSMEPGVNDTLFGGGKGFGMVPSLMSTLGEAAERVVATFVCGAPDLPGIRVLATKADLEERHLAAVGPRDVSLFADTQYESDRFLYQRFEDTSLIQWVPARRLRGGDEVYVPAQLVDMVHIFDPSEELIGYPVSGGLSCHTNKEAATYHGLTEVIERDAVNLSWYTPVPPRRLRIDESVTAVLGGFVDRLVHDHSTSAILVHPSACSAAPTISVVGVQDWLRRRSYCAGGGCDADVSTALRKAAAEFGQTRSTLGLSVTAPRSAVGRSVEEMFDWDVGRPLVDMRLFFQAIGFYGLEEHRHHLDHYLSGEEVTLDELREEYLDAPRSTTGERLRYVTDRLATSGIDPLVLDYGHPDWRRLSIVKLFVPELTTPFLQSRPMLGHPRLQPLRGDLNDPDGSNIAMPLPYP